MYIDEKWLMKHQRNQYSLRFLVHLCHGTWDEHFKNFIVGIELTEKELAKVFEAHNIQKHMPLNEKFDHNLHQALFDIPNEDAAPGTILQVVQSGYSLKDRLLRPAMVGVAKKQ